MSIPASMQYFVYRKFMKYAEVDCDLAIANLTYEFINGESVVDKVTEYHIRRGENRHTPLDEWLTPTEFFGRG